MKIFKPTRERLALLLTVLLSALLNFVNLGIEGYSNQYYAAAVKSMLLTWKNFFFAALDPAGFVSVDKPPLGYWLQALSAKLFGFSGWSILLPQALAGVLSVVVLYYLVKHSFGSRAGLISALCLAVTPVFVAVSRNNTVDNQLVLVLLLACWALSVAAEKGRLKYLLLAMLLIGLGFNIKMLQAYMILPAVYIVYLFANSLSLPKRIAHLLLGTVVLVGVSLSWALAVDSIPATARPYVGCSTNNTVMELITDHNGAERLGGIFSILTGGSGNPGGGPGGGGGMPPMMPNDRNGVFAQNNRNHPTIGQGNRPPSAGSDQRQPSSTRQDQGAAAGSSPSFQRDGSPGGPLGAPPDNNAMRPPGAFGGGGRMPGGGPGGNGGLAGTFGNQTPAGLTRLFQHNVLSDQIVWFIPLALFGFLAAAGQEKLRLRLENKRQQALALWFMWFLPVFIYFSYNTGLFHSYYLTMLAPPVAALSGIGLVAMWDMYKEGGWKSWLLPLALLANGAVQMLMLSYFYSSSTLIIQSLMGLLAVLTLLPGILLLALNLPTMKKRLWENRETALVKGWSLKKALVTLAVIGLLITPGTGSAAAMFKSVSGGMPGAGLELLPDTWSSGPISEQSVDSGRERLSIPGRRTENYHDLVAFLQQHPVNGQAQIVVASSNTAESVTLTSDVYVGSLSGFMGNQPVMSLARFQQKVKAGEIRYVLAEGNGDRGRGPGGGGGSAIMNWVQQTGKLVTYSGANGSNGQVYDLSDYTRQLSQ